MHSTNRLLSAALALSLFGGCTLLNDPTDLEPGPDTSTPGAPQDLAAVPGIGRMTLTWSPVTDWDFDHYNVYGAPTTTSLMKAGETTATTFVVEPLNNATVYDFMVLAVDRFGNVSEPSDIVTAQPDGVAPTVAGVTYNPGPQNPASVMTDVIFTFSEPMDPVSVEANHSVSTTAAVTPTCTWSWYTDNTEAKCDLVVGTDPSAPFTYDRDYTVTLGAGSKDRAGNALAGTPYAATFHTASAPDTDPPGLVSVTVSNHESPTGAKSVGTGSPGAVGVYPETNVVFTFDEPMDTVATGAAISVTAGAGYNGGTKTWNAAGTVMTFNPDVDYLPGATVTVAIGAGARDPATNPLPAFANRTFRTAYRATIDIYGEGAFDGWGTSTVVYTAGDGDVWPADRLIVGDHTGNGQYKGFVSFYRTGFDPEFTRFTAATLNLYQYNVYHTPYDDLDQLDFCLPIFGGGYRCYYTELLATHVDLGAALNNGDFASAALPTGSVEIVTSSTLGWWSANVLAMVEADRTAAVPRSRSSWRLEFPVATDADGVADWANFYTGEATNGLRPTLTLTYEYYQ
jgi:hypothetical protein